MMSGNETRDVNETAFDRFMTLADGDEFTAVGSDWTVESVEQEPRDCARVITAARTGAEHEWARFSADRGSLTVNAEIHDEDHEQRPAMNPHSVTSLTIHEREEPEPVTDGGEDVDPNAGVDTEQYGEVEVHGVEDCGSERGPYGDADPYEEHLTVTLDGEEHHIPVTGVRRAAYDFRGDVPDSVDMARVFRNGDELHAEAVYPDGSVVELYREGANDSWTLEHFPDPVMEQFVTVWARGGGD